MALRTDVFPVFLNPKSPTFCLYVLIFAIIDCTVISRPKKYCSDVIGEETPKRSMFPKYLAILILIKREFLFWHKSATVNGTITLSRSVFIYRPVLSGSPL